jgi:hypothetical protein
MGGGGVITARNSTNDKDKELPNVIKKLNKEENKYILMKNDKIHLLVNLKTGTIICL